MTTDTQPMAPTDAEIVELMRDGCNCRYNDEADHIDFARAVLAKWGQPARSGEPLRTMVGAAGLELATLCSQSSNAVFINQQLRPLLSNGGCLVARHFL